jgi:hypothetical protein
MSTHPQDIRPTVWPLSPHEMERPEYLAHFPQDHGWNVAESVCDYCGSKITPDGPADDNECRTSWIDADGNERCDG